MPKPVLILFDVNETLSDLTPMRTRFEEVGAPESLAQSWFAGVLRDGFALAAVGGTAPFATIAAELLRVHLHDVLGDVDDRAVEHVLDGFGGLPVHPDVAEGLGALSALGVRLATLSNGAASVAAGLLERAGLLGHFERLMSVDDAGVWKPAAGAYQYGVGQCEVDPADAMLVAVHPWDIDGASRAGLRTAWINRAGGPYPAHFEQPDLRVDSLPQLADQLR